MTRVYIAAHLGMVGGPIPRKLGFWYRYLVDAKVAEVKRVMVQCDCDVVEAIRRLLDIDVVRQEKNHKRQICGISYLITSWLRHTLLVED